MEWTGLEWNGMERGKQLSINAHAHTVPYTISLKFLVWGAVIIRILSRGKMSSGDWSTPLPRARGNS